MSKSVQQIRKHGASDHLPGGPDAIPWLGDYPYGSGEGNQGIHMIGLLADMPAPSLGTQTGADGAVASSSTAFSAASGRFTSANTGGTLQVIDTGASPPLVYPFAVTFVDATHLTLDSAWAGMGTSALSWSLQGAGPSNAGLRYFATDTPAEYQSTGSEWLPLPSGSGIMFNTDNEGGYLDVTTNDVDEDGHGFHLNNASTGDLLIESSGGTIYIDDDGNVELWSPSDHQFIGIGRTSNVYEVGIAILDNDDDGILLDSDASVNINTVQNGSLFFGRANGGAGGGDVDFGLAGGYFRVSDESAAAIFTVQHTGDILAAREMDLGGNNIVNLADGVNPQDAATVAQLGSGGGIGEVTSADGTVTVTDGTGPTVDLSVQTITIPSGNEFSVIGAAGGVPIQVLGDGTFIGLVLSSAGTFGVYDSSNDPLLWLEDGVTVPPTEGQVLTGHLGAPATWEDAGGSGIMFDTANTGTYLDITTTGNNGALGISLHDTDPDGFGIEIISDNGGMEINGFGGMQVESTDSSLLLIGANFVEMESGTDSVFAVDGVGSGVALSAAATFTIYDSAFAPMLQMIEGDPNLYIKTGGILSPTL